MRMRISEQVKLVVRQASNSAENAGKLIGWLWTAHAWLICRVLCKHSQFCTSSVAAAASASLVAWSSTLLAVFTK